MKHINYKHDLFITSRAKILSEWQVLCITRSCLHGYEHSAIPSNPHAFTNCKYWSKDSDRFCNIQHIFEN